MGSGNFWKEWESGNFLITNFVKLRWRIERHYLNTNVLQINTSLKCEFSNACDALIMMLPPMNPNVLIDYMDIERNKFEISQWWILFKCQCNLLPFNMSTQSTKICYMKPCSDKWNLKKLSILDCHPFGEVLLHNLITSWLIPVLTWRDNATSFPHTQKKNPRPLVQYFREDASLPYVTFNQTSCHFGLISNTKHNFISNLRQIWDKFGVILGVELGVSQLSNPESWS